MSRPRLRIVSSAPSPSYGEERVEYCVPGDPDRVFVGRPNPAPRVALIDARRPGSGAADESFSRSFHAMAAALGREARLKVFARSRLQTLLDQGVSIGKVARQLDPAYEIVYVFGVPYGLPRLREASPECCFIVHISESDLPECSLAEARGTLSCADAIITSSEPSKRRLQQLLPALSRRMHVVHPGANEEFLTVPSRPGQSQNILCISPLLPDRDIQSLLLAFTHVAAANPQTQLTVLGDRSRGFARVLRRHAHELGSYVRVERAVPYHDVGNYYARTGVFVLPSFSGDFAVTGLLDAMAAGLPVVCARTDVTAEIVTDGVTGVLIDPSDVYSFGNALRRLLDDPDLRRQIGAAARFDVARRFTWRSCFNALDRLRGK